MSLRSWIIPTLSLTTSIALIATAAEEAPVPATSPAAPAQPQAPSLAAEELKKSQDLWNTGMEAFLARNYSQAITALTEYIEKYPGRANAVEARFYLGQSYLFDKKPAEAVKPLQAAIEAGGRAPFVAEARIYLGNAYLDQKKFTEAYLVSEEILARADVSNTMKAKGLMLRAHAQAGLKQNLEAEKTLSVFQNLAEKDPELESELANSYLVTLFLKANACDRLPSAKTLPEDQVLDQISRKGLCVLEMGNQLTRAARAIDAEELKPGLEALEMSWKSLVENCVTPPLEKGKRTKVQWEKAKQELSAKLKESCENTTKLLQQSLGTRESLKSFAGKLKPGAEAKSPVRPN